MSLDADIDLAGSLSISLGKMEASLSRIDKREEMRDAQARLAAFPRQLALFSTPFTAAGFYDFDGPRPGRHWEVRLIGVIGVATPGLNTWVVGGTPPIVTFYEGQNVAALGAGVLPTGQVRWQFNSLPGFENFSGDQFLIHENQHLIVGVTTVPATTALTFIAIINDIPINRGQVVAAGA